MELQLKSIQKDIEESRLAFENAYIRLRGSYTVLLEDIEKSARCFENSHSTKEDAITARSGRTYIVIGHRVSVESDYHCEYGGLYIGFSFAEVDPQMNPTRKEAEYLEIYRRAMNEFLAKECSYAFSDKRASEKLTMIYASAEMEHLKNERRLVHRPVWRFSEAQLLERPDVAQFNLNYPDLGITFTI